MSGGIDVVRFVWSKECENLTVRPSGDVPGYVNVIAEGKEAIEFWGPVNLTMPKEMALYLAEAIKACAEEQP